MLSAAINTMRSLPAIQQVVLAHRYHQQRSLEYLAAGLEVVSRAHDEDVIAVHAALVAQGGAAA